MEPALEQETIVLEDETSRREITGWVIGDTWARGRPSLDPSKPQWSRNRVIRTPSHRYISARESWSRGYHTQPTGCVTASGEQRGIPVTAKEMFAELAKLGLTPQQAESCDVCEPSWPEDLSPDAVVRYETYRYSVDECDSVRQLIERVTRHRRRSGVVSSAVPQQVQDLLRQCARTDPDWEDAEKPVVQIR
jgi:hypothetical protein